MRILITNDDGIRAEGLATLAQVAREFGEVKIVAPDRERSACAHSMTMRRPLRVDRVDFDGIEAYQVDGVPVDCVNVGLTVAWPDGCDLILSGINVGPNLGFDVTYSGTVAGAMEGVINEIPSIALSVARMDPDEPLHMESAAQWLREHWNWLTSIPFKRLTLWNVNVPALPYDEIQGTQVVAMGERVYKDRVEPRQDPWGREYYWQGGYVVMDPSEPHTDVWAIHNGYVALTPISINWTDQEAFERVRREAIERSKG